MLRYYNAITLSPLEERTRRPQDVTPVLHRSYRRVGCSAIARRERESCRHDTAVKTREASAMSNTANIQTTCQLEEGVAVSTQQTAMMPKKALPQASNCPGTPHLP
eukprot:1146333-Pelagomonas_calceolata.AAC.6